MLFHSTGIIRYSMQKEMYVENLICKVKLIPKVIVEIDPEIGNYYFAQIPKYIRINRQKYSSHISTVRKEFPPRMEFWGKYDGKEIDFQYDPILRNDQTYWWINCFSKGLEELRLELGLPVSSPYTRPPDGLNRTFHSTIANTKLIQ